MDGRLAVLKCAARHLRGSGAALAFAVVSSILFVVVPMQVPILTGALVDGLHGRRVALYGVLHLPAPAERMLAAVVIGLVATAIASGIAAYVRAAAVASISRRVVAELRKTFMATLETMSLSDHRAYGSSELLNVAIVDTKAMRGFVEKVLIRTVSDTVRVVYPLSMLFVIDWALAAIAVSILPLQWLIGKGLESGLLEATRQARRTRRELTAAVKETLDGIETVRTSHAHGYFTEKMIGLAEQVESEEVATRRHSALRSASVWALTSLGGALTWWQGGLRVLAGDMTLGTLLVFTGFLAFVYAPSRRFSGVATRYQKGIVALERFREIVDTRPAIQDAPGARPLRVGPGRIEFRDVCFSYGERPILRGVDLTIRPREITAIVGRSGSGKSSMLKVLARLYDPARGRVLIDGQDLRGVTFASFRSQVGVVPQSPVIFTGTVTENICLGLEGVTEHELIAACEAADALHFIQGLDQGFQTRLGDGGASLSGGEAQRIALARALLRKPRILLLDEPSSAVDAESEAAILAALHRRKEHTTIVVVAHGERAIRAADRVVRFDQGTVVEGGSDDEGPVEHDDRSLQLAGAAVRV